MTWVAVAVVGGAVVGGAVSAYGANKAADTQAGAASNAQQISQNEFNTITQQNQPFMQSGYGALSQLDYLLGINGGVPGVTAYPGGYGGGTPQPGQMYPNAVTAPFSGAATSPPGIRYNTPSTGGSLVPGYDPSSGYQIGPGGSISQLIPGGSQPGSAAPPAGYPGSATGSPAGGFGSLLQPFTADTFQQYSPAYQFQKQQGTQGVLNADASGQGALSGSAYKDLIGYNQNLANTAFNNAFNQYQTQQGNIFTRLSGIAQMGQASANNTGQQGTALAGQAAQSATNIGTAQAAGQIGSANAISGAITSAAPWLAYGGGTTPTEIPDESMGVGG